MKSGMRHVLSVIVLTSVASGLGASAITAFNYAFTLLQIPIGVIGVPLGIVVLPSLSSLAAVGELRQFAGLISRAVRLTIFVMLPITGIAIVLRQEIVNVLFGYSRFDDAALKLIAGWFKKLGLKIEVSIIDKGFAEGWVTPRPPLVRTGRNVAVVGSGPAGLAAAEQLNRAGHLVTVFEKSDRLGGLLRYGIPEFKMEKRVLNRRLSLMEESGVQFRTGVTVGVDLRLERMTSEYTPSCWRAAPGSRAISRCRAET